MLKINLIFFPQRLLNVWARCFKRNDCWARDPVQIFPHIGRYAWLLSYGVSIYQLVHYPIVPANCSTTIGLYYLFFHLALSFYLSFSSFTYRPVLIKANTPCFISWPNCRSLSRYASCIHRQMNFYLPVPCHLYSAYTQCVLARFNECKQFFYSTTFSHRPYTCIY